MAALILVALFVYVDRTLKTRGWTLTIAFFLVCARCMSMLAIQEQDILHLEALAIDALRVATYKMQHQGSKTVSAGVVSLSTL